MAPKKATAKEEEKKAVEEKKRKADEKVEDAAPKKEAKKDEAAKKDVKKDGKKEDALEKEKDAAKDARQKSTKVISFSPADTTLNVVPGLGGKLLMALSEGGMQYLIAGARANVGMKAGRYLYEVKIVEALNPAESSGGQRGRVPMPRQLLRLGYSTAQSSLILGDSDDAAFFDSEGFYVSGKGKKAAASQRFTRDQVMGVLLNLDSKTPNNNTISLFRDGDRISEPQPLPAHLIGKPLFPHVSFRSVTVQMLFGPNPARPLSFQCRMLQGAAQADLVTAPAAEPAEGKYDVMLPVGVPDEGTFDWLDTFLEKNPHYVELSDRKVLAWAASSGLWKPKGGGYKTSNDKPEFNFGIPSMDDYSIRRVLNSVAPVVPRHYVVMEVKSNLLAAERKETLARFGAPHFRKVAHVVVGEPTAEYKGKQLERLLKEKQEKSDAEWKAKKAEEERKKQVEMRQKQLAEMRKKADEVRKKAAEDAKKKREEEAKKKAEEKKSKEEAERKAKEAAEKKEGEPEGEETKDEGGEAKEEGKAEEAAASMQVDETKDESKAEAKDEAKEESKEEEGDEKKDEDMEGTEEGPPQVELTEEEKSVWFKPVPAGGAGDLTSAVLGQFFAQFTLPEGDEGFDDIQCEWQDLDSSKEYLKKWVQERKLTSRIEDLQPGSWFQEKHAEWLKTYQDWQTKHKEYKNSAAKKAKDEAKKKREEEKEKEDGGEDDGKDEAEADYLDIFSVEDVCDVGGGEPLFANFSFEDWALLQLRVELYFLVVAFKKDVDDEERLGIHESHIAFYYNKYYRKQLNPKYFGLNTNTELCKLVKDTVAVSEDTQVLVSTLAEETESVTTFVKLTEESRRERQRRTDAGDETAKLKFSTMAMQQAAQTQKPAPVASAWAGAAAAAGARPGAAWGAAHRPATTVAARWPGAQPAAAYAPRAAQWRK